MFKKYLVCRYLCDKLETARILVFGNVQGVGFRAYIEQIARGMQIKGFVRNLDDDKVEIYAQAPKKKISAFVKKIDIKGSPLDPFSLNVTKIQVVFEHSKNFIRPDRVLGRFETDYGKESDLQREMVKKAAVARLLMHSLNSKSDSLISKTDSLVSKTDTFRKETSNNFNKLDGKYGSVSSALKSINGGIKRIDGNIKHIGTNIKENNKLLSKIAKRF